MRTGNVFRGNYVSTPERSMRAFDRLPGPVREALRCAVDDWATQPLLTALKRGKHDASELVHLVRSWDAEELDERARHSARAIGAYEGNKPSQDGRTVSRKGRR